LHEQVTVRARPAGHVPTQSSQLVKPVGQPTVEIQGACPFGQPQRRLVGQYPVQHRLDTVPGGRQGVPAP
jgi:hypothetical protein